METLQQEVPSHSKLLAAISLGAVLDFGLLLFAIYLVFKVYMLVKLTDKPMFLSIIAITTSLILLLIFCILDIISLYASDQSYLNTVIGSNLVTQIDRLKVTFIFCAFIFDLYKWCVFIAATGRGAKEKMK